MLELSLLLGGFVPLILGAHWLVDGGSALARRLRIAPIVIGLTIVAFGTSAPELVVNTLASVRGNSDIVLGNVIGSNIFNILLILGISSLITPLAVKTQTTWYEVPLAILAALAVGVMALDHSLDGGLAVIQRSEGIILLFFFIIFMVYNAGLIKQGGAEEEWSSPDYTIPKSLLFILLGIGGLALGGKLIVDNAVAVATRLGISPRVIGLTIVSIGTSLPELATSIVAARKKSVDIAIGNVVGSNIFNVFFILGLSALIRPVPVNPASFLDLGTNVLASLLLFLFIFTGKGRQLERWEGALFILTYCAYMVLLLV